jgi:hypothetical protein
MPAYNFQQRFAEKVGNGTKRHTIRAKRKDGKRPQAGQPFRSYTGMRTKNCEPILFSTISKVEDVRIDDMGWVSIDGRLLTHAELDALSVADGFAGAADFLAFFRERYGIPFLGDLIHWTFTTGSPTPNGDKRGN